MCKCHVWWLLRPWPWRHLYTVRVSSNTSSSCCNCSVCSCSLSVSQRTAIQRVVTWARQLSAYDLGRRPTAGQGCGCRSWCHDVVDPTDHWLGFYGRQFSWIGQHLSVDLSQQSVRRCDGFLRSLLSRPTVSSRTCGGSHQSRTPLRPGDDRLVVSWSLNAICRHHPYHPFNGFTSNAGKPSSPTIDTCSPCSRAPMSHLTI